MKFSDLSSPATGEASCELRSDALQVRLRVEGLDAAALAPMLTGIGSRPDWSALLQQGCVSADNVSALAPSAPGAALAATEQKVSLPDGQATLLSGAAGRVSGPVQQVNPDLLIPQCLHLLLAQQWARSGITPLHAAALETPVGGVLILGPQAGGKSVLSLAALVAGLGVITDDWLLLGIDSDGQAQGERLRNFMMMREGPATNALLSALSELAFQSLPERAKSILNIDQAHPQFPVSAPLRHCWVLQPPAAQRPERSELGDIQAGALLAALIGASMPLLFSGSFPFEHEALMRSARVVLTQARCRTLETGTDLINDPHEALHRLLATS